MTRPTLTPIGTSPAYYNPGEATSGYLLEAEGTRVLIDCGHGVVSRYLELFGVEAPLDAVVISHIHADHVSDLVPLTYGILLGGLEWPRPQLHLPPGGRERLETMLFAFDARADFLSGTWDIHSYATNDPFAVGPWTVRAVEVPHFIESWALRFEAGSRSFVYSGDLGPTPNIVELAHGADLMFCEATWGVSASRPGHLTAAEAGQIAADAGVGKLVLTHIADALRTDETLGAAAAVFGNELEFARSGVAYPITACPATVGGVSAIS